jgi:ArsR family transcriptional regulator
MMEAADHTEHILSRFKALADPTRMRLASLLLGFELNVKELVKIMDMGQSRISRHLKILAEAGLVSMRRDGLWVFYAAQDQGPGRVFLDRIRYLFEGPDFEVDAKRARSVVAERTTKTRRFFDSVAGDWTRLSLEVLGEFDLTDQIVKRLEPCRVAADLGCGTGELLPAMKTRAETIIGVDHSRPMLDIADRRMAGETGVSFRLGDLEHLPLRDGEADAAVICLALHHLATPRDGIMEAGRVLAPGGRLVLADFDKHDQEAMRERHGDQWLGFARMDLANWLADAGLEIMEQKDFPLDTGLTAVITAARKTQDNSLQKQ